MKLLNIGCGYVRPKEPFINLDNLLSQFKEGAIERTQLLNEPNYVDHDISSGALPFDNGTFTGIACCHCLEHFELQAGVALLRESLRVMATGGVLLVSVPDASYFRAVDAEDKNENWQRLFGEGDAYNPIPTYREAALFFVQHRTIFTEDSLWCCMRQAGVSANNISRVDYNNVPTVSDPVTPLETLLSITNRRLFSLVMTASI